MQPSLLYLSSLLSGVAFANSHCGSNAWISWTITSTSPDKFTASVKTTSGKNSGDLSSGLMVQAFGDCAVGSKTACEGGFIQGVTCNQPSSQVPGNSKGGSGNIEFSCSDGPYTCYNFNWS